MPGPKAKVLLVEDNYMNKVLIKEILTLNGYETAEASNGAEAVRMIATERPDLVLMDLHLPEMDGVTATRIIRADRRYEGIPVLALTASASRGDEGEILGKGFDGCVTKPIDRGKFLETIERSLREKKSR